jgi:hypothetical protein
VADDLAAQLADARHELGVLRGIAVDLEQRLDLALGDVTRALGERDQARADTEQAGRDKKSWQDWAAGHKTTAAEQRRHLGQAWAELDTVRGERDQLEREVTELRALFDLQFTRMGDATARWRAKDPDTRALVLPDLGNLLQWLMADADQVRGELAKTVSNFEEYAETTAEANQELRAELADADRRRTAYEEGVSEQVEGLRDELRRAQSVIEAAKAWRARIVDPPDTWADNEALALIAAVDALDHGEAGRDG